MYSCFQETFEVSSSGGFVLWLGRPRGRGERLVVLGPRAELVPCKIDTFKTTISIGVKVWRSLTYVVKAIHHCIWGCSYEYGRTPLPSVLCTNG